MTNSVTRIFSNLGQGLRRVFKRSRNPPTNTAQASADPEAAPQLGHKDSNAANKKTTKLVSKIAINFLYYFPLQLGYVMEYVFLFMSDQPNQPSLVTSAGLSNTVVETLLVVPVFSLNLGLATLVSQAVGASQFGVAGFYLLRSILINVFVFTVCSFLLPSSSKVMGLMGSSEEVIDAASKYITYGFISSVLACIFDLMRNFVQAHQIFRIPALVQCTCTLGYLLLQFTVVKLFGAGLTGLGVCKIIGEFAKSVILIWYVRRAPKLRLSIVSFRRDYFKLSVLWTQMKKQSFAGSLFFLDWFGFLFMCFVVSGLESADVSSFFVSFTIITLFTAFADSISAPLSVMIGHAAGGGSVEKVRRNIKVGFIAGVIVAVTMSMLMSLVRKPLPYMFTNNDEVAAKASRILYTFCWVFPFYMGQNIMVAIFRSLGKEKTASKLLLLSIYAIGIPCSALLGYPLKLGVYGVRYGYAIGILSNVVLFTRLFCKLNLQEQTAYISDQLSQDDRKNIELIEQARAREQEAKGQQAEKPNDQVIPENEAPKNPVVGINLEEDSQNQQIHENIGKELDHNVDRISDIYQEGEGETPNIQDVSADVDVKEVQPVVNEERNESPPERSSVPTEADTNKSLFSNAESLIYAKNSGKKDGGKSSAEQSPELETKAGKKKSKYATLPEEGHEADANAAANKNPGMSGNDKKFD